MSETNSKFAIGYQFNDKLWSDLRIYSGASIDRFTPEIVLNYNYLRKEDFETYLGFGVVLNNINGIVLPIGIAIKPFENFKNLSLNIECSPLYEIDLSNIFITGLLGVRYRLN